MRRTFILLSFSTALLFACNSKNKTASENKDSETGNRAADSTEIRNTVLAFYTWYSTNYEKLMKYDLYDGVKEKDAPPYKLNWDEVAKYQAFIHDSIPQLGETFRKNQDQFFKKCDSAFKVDVGDDVPYYFDYDWYTNTQEDPAYLLEEMNKSRQWLMNFSGDQAGVEIKGFDENGTKPSATVINLQMQKENGQWKIAKIGND